MKLYRGERKSIKARGGLRIPKKQGPLNQQDLWTYELTEAEAACTRACKGLHQVVSQSTKEKKTDVSIPNLEATLNL